MIANVRHRPGCNGVTETLIGRNAPAYGVERCTECRAVRTLTAAEALNVSQRWSSDGRNADRSTVGGTRDGQAAS